MAAQYYIEFVRVENQVKVTALDPETGREATVICPLNTAKKDMMNLAVKKLQYVLKKAKDA